MTHSMNGAVETRSNWKGLNAGLREVPSMSFTAGLEGEDVRNTRERAWKSDSLESDSFPDEHEQCPRTVTVTSK